MLPNVSIWFTEEQLDQKELAFTQRTRHKTVGWIQEKIFVVVVVMVVFFFFSSQ